MSVVDFFVKEKGVDIIISLSTTVLGLVLGYFIDSIRKKGTIGDSDSPISYQRNVSITNIENYYNDRRNKKSDKESSKEKKEFDEQLFWIIIWFVIIVSLIVYFFFRNLILNIATYSTLLAFSILLGGIIHSIAKGYYSRSGWTINIVLTTAFCIAAMFVIYKAFNPDFAPKNFENLQEIVNEGVLKGYKENYTIMDLLWFVFHILGVWLLFIAITNMLLSNLNFVFTANYLLKRKKKMSWFLRKLKVYDKYNQSVAKVFLILLFSWVFISGNAFVCLYYKMPIFSRHVADIIANGR